MCVCVFTFMYVYAYVRMCAWQVNMRSAAEYKTHDLTLISSVCVQDYQYCNQTNTDTGNHLI